jgi:hypothetical protein
MLRPCAGYPRGRSDDGCEKAAAPSFCGLQEAAITCFGKRISAGGLTTSRPGRQFEAPKARTRPKRRHRTPTPRMWDNTRGVMKCKGGGI